MATNASILIKILISGLFFLFYTEIEAQLAEVPCICETTSLELIPLIQPPKIILITEPGNSSTRWEYETIAELEEEIPEVVPTIIEEEVIENNRRSSTKRVDFSRKRKKNKYKVKLKKKSFKKYRGQCPVF